MIGDGLQNLVTNLGTISDKNYFNTYCFLPMQWNALEAMYRSSPSARKVVEILPKDQTREWRAWADKEEEFREAEFALNLRSNIRQAMTLARLYGGAGIVLGVGDDPSQELDVNSIGQGDLRYVLPFHRHELHPEEVNDDILDPNFGLARQYRLQRTGHKANNEPPLIHHTRMVFFHGAGVPRDVRERQQGWSDSVLEGMRELIEAGDVAIKAIGTMLHEAKTDVIKTQDLKAAVATAEGERRLLKRFQLAAMAKSVNRMLLLGDGEDYESTTLSFQGVSDAVSVVLRALAAAADVPITRFLGESPGGLNSTGESDLRNYYDNIRAMQVNELEPSLDRLDTALRRHVTGSDEPIEYTWNPLFQMTEQQRAEVEKKDAETDKIYIESGIFDQDALAGSVSSRLEADGRYPDLKVAEEVEPIEFEEPEVEPDPETPPTAEPAAPSGQQTEIQRLALNGAQVNALKELIFSVAEQDIPEQTAVEMIKVSFPAIPEASILAMLRPVRGFRSNRQRGEVEDAAPRTLYVSRAVVNAAEIIAWAREQGFETTLPADDLHVTIAFSRKPVDWMKVGEAWQEQIEIAAGGPRLVEALGAEGDATVLMFASSELSWRHEDIKRQGASWDWPEYQPHITISYQRPEGMDLRALEPYRGKIVLGPEVFDEVREDWKETISET